MREVVGQDQLLAIELWGGSAYAFALSWPVNGVHASFQAYA